MAKNAADRLRESVSDVGTSSPAVKAAEMLASVGDKAAEVVDTVKRKFAPLLPGQTAPKRRGDIPLPREGKKS